MVRRKGLSMMRSLVFVGLSLMAFGGARAQDTGLLYLELDGHWYSLPSTPGSLIYSFQNGYEDIYLPTATFTMCAPKSGAYTFGEPFLYYGPSSFPIYEWKTFS